jgi:glycosyltransferase involved in cell wall biosynthesis
MTTSVIISTHNSPGPLSLVLAGYARQDRRDFELLIADDGSREETRDLIRRVRQDFPVPLIHVWQPHRGYYGKMGSMNRALSHASGDYIIAADGDVVPRHDFVSAHIQHRRPRTFLAAGDFRLSPEATRAVTLDAVRSGEAFTAKFLEAAGQPRTKKFLKLRPRDWVTRLVDAVNVSPGRWTGSNASGWKADLVAVNGWDESIHHPGKDDTELGQRLRNSGVRTRHIRHNALALHLYHGEGRPNHPDNLALLKETTEQRLTRARIGLDSIKPDDHTVER